MFAYVFCFIQLVVYLFLAHLHSCLFSPVSFIKYMYEGRKYSALNHEQPASWRFQILSSMPYKLKWHPNLHPQMAQGRLELKV